jgi:GAF domain
MAKRTVSDPKKPVLDEQTLDRLLEAAFVIQEQGDLQKQTRNPATADQIPPSQFSTNEVPATLIASSSAAGTVATGPASISPGSVSPVSISPASIHSASVSKDAYTLTLAQIVETQQQILTRRLELENAMALVAQRAAEITGAAGSAIGIVESKTDGKKLQYRAVSGHLTLARGSEVAMEKALCFNCLRSGEVIRGADVNSDFLLDAEECRRRGIGSLIAVPIYRDNGIAGALELYAQLPVDGWIGDGSAGPRCRRLLAQVAGGGARHHAGSSGKTAAQSGGLDGESGAERIRGQERGIRGGNRAQCDRSHGDACCGGRFCGESCCGESCCSEFSCGQCSRERACSSHSEKACGGYVFLPQVWPRAGGRRNVLRKVWLAAQQRISASYHAEQAGFALADATGEQAECCARSGEWQRAASGAENQSRRAGGSTALGSSLIGVGGPLRRTGAAGDAGTGSGMEAGAGEGSD